MLFVDTSVVVAFYIPETNSRRAQRLFSSELTLAISSLVEVEFSSAVARLVRMKHIAADDGRRVLEAFQSHIEKKFYAFTPITQEVYRLAHDWIGSFRTALRTLDALQLAAAHTHGLSFVTTDKALAQAARQLDVALENL